MIDFHAHMGNMAREGYPASPPLSAQQLVNWMDRNGIDRAVILPLESPEGSWGYLLTEEAVAARDLFPQRLIAFCCVDPRYPNAAKFIRYHVERNGCKGLGEHVNGLAFDDPLNLIIYQTCDELALPLVFEINDNLCFDEPGLPRLERCLREFPNIRWVGHGPAFWSAISADDPRQGYPSGPIKPGGALDRLFDAHENLYADLSAGSGFNAMTRDPEFAQGFINRWWTRLLWGSDIVFPHQPIPQITWFGALNLDSEERHAIAEGNAARLLGL